MGNFDLGPNQPPSTIFHGARLDRWWGRRRIAETGEALQERRSRITSNVAILAWILGGLALILLAVLAWSVFVVFTIVLGLVGIAALGTGIARWRDNHWLKPPTD